MRAPVPESMKRSIKLRRLALCGAVLCLIVLGLLGHLPRPVDGLEVRILDVGQGDAALIRTGAHCLLIDAGANGAEETLCSTLRALGVRRLDAVIFTHPDEDHIGGGDLVLAQFPVGTIYIAPVDCDESSCHRLL